MTVVRAGARATRGSRQFHRWHGAAPDRLFALAMSENGEQGQGPEWAERVSDAEYMMQPAAD
jgi:hypothetical protein